MSFFLVVFFFLFVLGYLAQSTGLCLVRGVNEALDKRPQFLFSILLSGVVGWVSFVVADLLSIDVSFRVFAVQWTAMFGGVLFGVGAALNFGCGVSTISKLSRGDTLMIATVTGWFIGWFLLTGISEHLPSRVASTPSDMHFTALVVISVVVALCIALVSAMDTRLWLSMLTIGLMASLTFLYEPRWTPSGYLSDVSASLWQKDTVRWPNIERTLFLFALIGGMVVAALKTRSFRWKVKRLPRYMHHLIAGVLMGCGASIAGGGNDSQLMLSLPAFSPYGFVTVLSMLVGIALGLKLPKRFK
ncbi:YeeE/YedE thiosulfate transporter family protein [Enterovibrio calviensis]|uniref:YeeE/YedE thiosulfate transporter family protein n=1 Tax=Enterovibrio calviensis TaxID=91359 RepID=UPI00047F36C9|nr:YeeE/YedE thiosulfate transporter family protein [Enterovibrio calviensis]